jgi:hypothetical protein
VCAPPVAVAPLLLLLLLLLLVVPPLARRGMGVLLGALVAVVGDLRVGVMWCCFSASQARQANGGGAVVAIVGLRGASMSP